MIIKSKRQWHELPLPTQAAIRCGEPRFWRFLVEHRKLSGPISTPVHAAAVVRFACGVKSRSELGSDKGAADTWRNLDAAYDRWLLEQETAPIEAPPHDHNPYDGDF